MRTKLDQCLPHKHKVSYIFSHLQMLLNESYVGIGVKKRFFIILLKNGFFNVFLFWNIFYFLVAKFISLNLLNSCIKRLLSDGFNMAAIKNSHMKSHSLQMLSCILRQCFTGEFFVWFD